MVMVSLLPQKEHDTKVNGSTIEKKGRVCCTFLMVIITLAFGKTVYLSLACIIFIQTHLGLTQTYKNGKEKKISDVKYIKQL